MEEDAKDQAALDYIQSGKPFDESLRMGNPELYQRIYNLVMGEPLDHDLGKLGQEAVNAAIQNGAEHPQDYVDAYMQGKTSGRKEDAQFQQQADAKARAEMTKRLQAVMAANLKARQTSLDKARAKYDAQVKALKQTLNSDRIDALQKQHDATVFADQHVPLKERARFFKDVEELSKYRTSPSVKYPQGERQAKFDDLMARLANAGAEAKKTQDILEMAQAVSDAREKRSWKGIPVSGLPGVQEEVNRIGGILKLEPAATRAQLAQNTGIIQLIDNDPHSSGAWTATDGTVFKRDDLVKENLLLSTYGGLANQPPAAVAAAKTQLLTLIAAGKDTWQQQVGKVHEAIVQLQDQVKREVNRTPDITITSLQSEEHTKHSRYMLSFESLPTLLRQLAPEKDFDASAAGKLYRLVEDASWAEGAANYDFRRRFQQVLEMAGVKGLKERGRFYNVAKEVAEHSGAYIDVYSAPAGEPGYEYDVTGKRPAAREEMRVEDTTDAQGHRIPGARSLLRDYEQGSTALTPGGHVLDDVSAEFLRRMIGDLDQKLVYKTDEQNSTGEDWLDEDITAQRKELQKSGRVRLLFPNPKAIPAKTELKLSRAAALQLVLEWEQPEVRAAMKWNGYSEETYRQLKQYAGPALLKVGYALRDDLKLQSARLDAAARKLYGVGLPEIENYWPSRFDRGPGNPSGSWGAMGSFQRAPGFLAARRFHPLPPDITQDAFSVFSRQLQAQEHFIAWQDAAQYLDGVFRNSAVQTAIRQAHGAEFLDALQQRLAVEAAGGAAGGSDFVANFVGYFPVAKLGLNFVSGLKQALGQLSYVDRVPAWDFLKYIMQANGTNSEYRAWLQKVRDGGYFKARLGGELDKELSFVQRNSADGVHFSPFLAELNDKSYWMLKQGDAFSVLHGGYAAYKYKLEQCKHDGMAPEDAEQEAMRFFQRATDETQQSAYLKDQNAWQSSQGWERTMTMFLSNPIETTNIEIQAVQAWRKTHSQESLKTLGRVLFINHVLVPALMNFVLDLVQAGFDPSALSDVADASDYWLGLALGGWDSLPLAGKALTYFINAIEKHTWNTEPLADVAPVGTDALNGAAKAWQKSQLKREWTADDWLQFLQGASQAMTAGGFIPGPIGEWMGFGGAAGQMLTTQGRRVNRIVNPTSREKSSKK